LSQIKPALTIDVLKADYEQRFRDIAKRLVGPERLASVNHLLDHLVNDTDFFIAPASSKNGYHFAEDCGLAMHTWNVLALLVSAIDNLFGTVSIAPMQPTWKVKPGKELHKSLLESAVIVAIAHDLNKTTVWGKQHYVHNILAKGRSEAMPWVTNKERPAMGSLDQLLLASRFIALKPDEAQAIYYAEGKYNYAYRDIEGKEEVLTILLHHADMQAAFIVEAGNSINRDHKTLWDHCPLPKPTEVMITAGPTE
jgi:hypothetical protein